MVAPPGFEPGSLGVFDMEHDAPMPPKPSMLDRYTTGLLLGHSLISCTGLESEWIAILENMLGHPVLPSLKE